MVNESPDTPPGRTLRPTRRGRLVLFIGVVLVLVVAAAVLVPLLTGGPKVERARSLVIPEGWRASQVYEAVDKALDVEPGTTEKAATTADLPLPAAAKGNPEGYLFPAT